MNDARPLNSLCPEIETPFGHELLDIVRVVRLLGGSDREALEAIKISLGHPWRMDSSLPRKG